MPPPGSPDDTTGRRSLNGINIVSSLLFDRELRTRDETPRPDVEISPPVHSYTNFQIRRGSLPDEVRNIDSLSSSEAESDINMNDESHDNPERTDLHSQSIPLPGARFLSDVSSNERLLLASGRQFFDNRHSLESQGILQRLENALEVSSSREPRGAIALRRQNAIRRKRRSKDLRLPTQRKPSIGTKEKSTAILKDILKAFNDFSSFVDELDLQSSSNPIFNCYLKHQFGRYDNQLHMNLESKLDSFLRSSKQDRMHERSAKKRSKSKASASKRRKLSKRCHHDTEDNDDDPETIKSDRFRKSIMNIMYSSSLREGSTFNLKNDGIRDLNFIITKIDYATREIKGLFNIIPSVGEHTESVLHSMMSFRKFLIGKHDILIENLNLSKKINLLHSLANYLGSGNSKLIDEHLRYNTFKFEVAGEMINFADNDLRFLKKFELNINKHPDISSMSIRNLHLIRTKNSRIRLQLMKWLSIDPFKQFEDSYLMKNILNFKKSINGLNSKSSKDKIVKYFILLHGFVVNLHALSKNSGISKLADLGSSSNPLFKKYKAMKRNFKSLREKLNSVIDCNSQFNCSYHCSKYLKDWEFKLINNFAETLSCNQNCLLDVQLNFILFEFKVNLHQYIDSTFNYLFDNLRCMGLENFEDSFDSINEEFKHLKEDDDYLIFICSMNRKSGELMLENTRLVTNETANPFSTNLLNEGFSHSPTPTYNIFSFLEDDDDDDADYDSNNNDLSYDVIDDTRNELNVNDDTNNTHDEDNEISSDSSAFDTDLSDGVYSDNEISDVIRGSPTRSNPNPYSIGGGNQVYSVI